MAGEVDYRLTDAGPGSGRWRQFRTRCNRTGVRRLSLDLATALQLAMPRPGVDPTGHLLTVDWIPVPPAGRTRCVQRLGWICDSHGVARPVDRFSRLREANGTHRSPFFRRQGPDWPHRTGTVKVPTRFSPRAGGFVSRPFAFLSSPQNYSKAISCRIPDAFKFRDLVV
jgi:hypothetical protein